MLVLVSISSTLRPPWMSDFSHARELRPWHVSFVRSWHVSSMVCLLSSECETVAVNSACSHVQRARGTCSRRSPCTAAHAPRQASQVPLPFGGVRPFDKDAYSKAMAPDGDGEYVCTVRACDFKILGFAHGPHNLPPIGAIKQSWRDNFQKAAGITYPIPISGGAGIVALKAGSLTREGNDAYFLSWLLGWSLAVSKADDSMAMDFRKFALSIQVRFVRVADAKGAMALKWSANKSWQSIAEGNALHGIRLSLGILDQFEALAALNMSKKMTVADRPAFLLHGFRCPPLPACCMAFASRRCPLSCRIAPARNSPSGSRIWRRQARPSLFGASSANSALRGVSARAPPRWNTC